ncbi:MAG: hypothetical protein VCF24_30035, partial [Candidatus Latescibacterota bacterium]
MDTRAPIFRLPALLNHSLAACVCALLTLAPSGVLAGDATVDKLTAQARRQAADSRTKARPAARVAPVGSAIDRGLSKLARGAAEEEARSLRKFLAAPIQDPAMQTLLTKLRGRVAIELMAARLKAGNLPLPARRAAATLQAKTELVYGDTTTGSVLVDLEQVQYGF